MQQPTHPIAPMAPIPPASISTDQIQKYLDENKQLILAILENQNLGKLAECAQYQAQLQKNLLYLAAIADAQPPNQAVRPQMVHHPAMQQGSPFGQQVVGFPPRPPLQYNTQQIQEPQQQQQQIYPQVMPFPGNMGMRPGMMNGMLAIHPEPFRGTNSELSAGPSRSEASRGGGNVPASSTIDVPGKKQDAGKLTTPHSSSAPPTTSAADGSSTSAAQRGAGEATTQTPAATEKSEGSKTT